MKYLYVMSFISHIISHENRVEWKRIEIRAYFNKIISWNTRCFLTCGLQNLQACKLSWDISMATNSPKPFFDDCDESSIQVKWWAIPEHSILVQYRREDEDDWKTYGKVLPVPSVEAMSETTNRNYGTRHMQHAKVVGLTEKTTYKLRLQAEADGHVYEPSEPLTIDTQAPHWPLIHRLATFCGGSENRSGAICK